MAILRAKLARGWADDRIECLLFMFYERFPMHDIGTRNT